MAAGNKDHQGSKKRRPVLHQEKGAALVGVMMTMLVLTLLGTSAFIQSAAELKVSSNYSQSLEALYAAEAGLQELLASYRQNPSSFLRKQTGADMNLPVNDPGRSFYNGTTYWIKELHYDAQEVPGYVEVIIYGRDRGQTSLARLRATLSCSQGGGTTDLPSVFKMGIVSAGRIELNGPIEIAGTLHANRGVYLDQPSVADPLKRFEMIITQSLDPLRSDYLPPMEVPVISDQAFQNLRSSAQQKGNQILFGEQNLVLSGDQKGAVIFVDGQVTLTGTQLSGLTVIATGSITINGSTVLNAQGNLDTVFIAGGNISINEFSQIAGLFWTNGSIITVGAGRLKGAIVCQGSIRQQGGFQFERYDQYSSSSWYSTPSGYSFTVRGWSQI
jgi:hypothetical protein